jgi:hypothetical protein
MRSSSFVIILLLLVSTGSGGCYTYRIDTAEKHCRHLLELKKDTPFWALFTVVSFHNDDVLDDLVALLNETYMKKFEGRIDRAVWREGTPSAGVLHVTNPSSLFVVKPEVFIEEWRRGIEEEVVRRSPMKAGDCLFAQVTLLSDAVHVHSLDDDPTRGVPWTDTVIVLPTGRKERFARQGLPLPGSSKTGN